MTGRLEKEQKAFAKLENRLKDMPPVVTDWYYAMRAEEKSYHTIAHYFDALSLLMKKFNFTKDDFYKEVNPSHINRLMLSLRTRIVDGKEVPMSVGPRHQTWYGLNAFFRFLQENEYIEKNPILPKSKPKQKDNPEIVAMTLDDVNKYIDNINEYADEKFRNRDLCIFVLGVTTGLRSAAIIQMNIEDIDFENRKIHVIEKRNKVFDVMIDDTLYKCLLNWLADRRKYFPKVETDALFISNYARRLTYNGLYLVITKYNKGIDKKVTPHVMRHTCATMLYEETGDIYLTATQLNHSSVATTQRYADMSDKKRRDATALLGNKLKLK